MAETPTSVPQVPRPDRPSRPLVIPLRFSYRFPAPDDEPYDGVNQVEFAAQYLASVVALMVAVAFLAAFVLVPLVGQIVGHAAV